MSSKSKSKTNSKATGSKTGSKTNSKPANDSNRIRGTVATLLSMGLTLNGHAVDQPTLSVLTRLGFAKEVGKVPPTGAGGRGKPAKVWEFNSRANMAFSLNPSAAAATVALSAPEAEHTSESEGPQEPASEPQNVDAAPATQSNDSTFAGWDAERTAQSESVEA